MTAGKKQPQRPKGARAAKADGKKRTLAGILQPKKGALFETWLKNIRARQSGMLELITEESL